MAQPAITRPAPLTLHLEAQTLEELMDMLDEVMSTLRPEYVGSGEVKEDEDGASLDLTVHGSKEEADAAPKKTRGRPKGSTKKAAEAPDEAPDTSDAPAEDDGSMENLTPKAAREKGTNLIQTYFAQNPNNLAKVTAISAKYGVTKFIDIPDDKAAAFLADAILLANGT
jgi:hypothetical protein